MTIETYPFDENFFNYERNDQAIDEKNAYELYAFIFEIEKNTKELSKKNEEKSAIISGMNRYADKFWLIHFHEEVYFNHCVKCYQQARFFLKRCGKPKDAYDRLMVALARQQEAFYKEFGVAT